MFPYVSLLYDPEQVQRVAPGVPKGLPNSSSLRAAEALKPVFLKTTTWSQKCFSFHNQCRCLILLDRR